MKNLDMIYSQDNNIFKQAVSLNKRKFRKKYGLFLLEGSRAILQAKENNVNIKCIFINEEFTKKYSDVWDEINPLLTSEKYSLSNSLFDKLSDTVTSQGIVAVCEIPKYDIDDILTKERSFVLLLDQVQDPGNLGTIIRTSLAYGVDAIFLTKGTVDVFSPKVSRSSMCGNLCLPIVEQEDTVDSLKKSGYTLYCTSLSANSISYREISFNSKVALVLGNEGNGVSKNIIDNSHYEIVIPIRKSMESLNVGIATGILVNEISYKLFG